MPRPTFVVIAASMIELSSTGQLLAALATARDVEVQAYTLSPAIAHALEDAAERGAHVGVELEATPFADAKGGFARRNGSLVDALRTAGADAKLVHPMHSKAIEVDGTLYLDDENWGRGGFVLRDGDPADAKTIPTLKSDALVQEGRLLRGARSGDGVIVQSESFGRANSVYFALRALCKEGFAPRLLVSENDLRGNAKERAVLDELVADGVQVRVSPTSDKLALAGDRAWVGSANATAAFDQGQMPDWGITTGDPAIVGAVRARLEAQWNGARALKPQRASTRCDR